MLTAQQIALVQSTFGKIALMSDDVAAMFYERLFELDPSLRSLFRTAMPDQGYKLMQMVGTAVMGLDRLEELVPAIQDLGRRHAGYGVKRAYYDTVGEALLWALGDDFTADTRDAWTAVYSVLAETATEGVY